MGMTRPAASARARPLSTLRSHHTSSLTTRRSSSAKRTPVGHVRLRPNDESRVWSSRTRARCWLVLVWALYLSGAQVLAERADVFDTLCFCSFVVSVTRVTFVRVWTVLVVVVVWLCVGVSF